jgi:CBS domain-containing protein
MLAKHISKNKEIFCPAEMPLIEVFKKMTELKCPCMPIVESPAHKNIIGTITEHDICVKVLDGGLNPQRISAGRVVNSSFTTVSGEMPLEQCAELLKLNGIEKLFVVDENGAYLGILTESDFLIPENPVVSREPVMSDFAVSPTLSKQVPMAH